MHQYESISERRERAPQMNPKSEFLSWVIFYFHPGDDGNVGYVEREENVVPKDSSSAI